jgi:transcriptional regulator
MYRPTSFQEDRLEVMHALMRAHPLATLVSGGAEGLLANLVPFLLIQEGDKGVLRTHLARGNEQLQSLRHGAEVLVIFQGPQSYITPSWYASKAEHGKVVPTWNYVVVQARGVARVIDDPLWLRAQVEALTAEQERPRAAPWQVSDAPESYVSGQLKGIVGVEIPIGRLEGKWKVSQNRSEADRQGVHVGLGQQVGHEDMARMVANQGPVID